MINNKCLNCQKETNNPKYCSRSCSAISNNKIPKRVLSRKCANCDDIVKNRHSSLCELHSLQYQSNKRKYIENLTLNDYIHRNSLKNSNSSKYTHIRILARNWFKSLTKLPCANCGYSNHVELCHIKPISSFLNTALIKEINCIDNLIQLCRNCHWEFDNNLISLELIKSDC